ncbi:hypothetical protein [Clostridium sp. 'White wine YQ']|uniref:hypothetical protein n=1 Tax=Clostridium sp. 'White wine YQ' TaxID=3027474 RepID=UPI002366427E|nr:hypothetical protein [Clostridium sp. 'White wine YQ']MDD7793950.1 hypothetical protein [Clostridium sp. 'White wine YQ']
MRLYKNFIPIEISIKEKKKSTKRFKNLINILLILNILLLPMAAKKVIQFTSFKESKPEVKQSKNNFNNEKIKYILELSKEENINVRIDNNSFYINILNVDSSSLAMNKIKKIDEEGKINIKDINYNKDNIEIKGEL